MTASKARATVGLRELKKQRTRAQIADTALELFTERGFDAVTVAEVARAAVVSEATVFNYFRTKEDLVFDRLDQFWTRLLDAVAHRPVGEGLVDAVERFLLGQHPPAETPEQAERLTAITRMITTSPALLARERASYDQAATDLAALIARTTPLGADATAAAHLVLAIHKTSVAFTREQILAGVSGPLLTRRVTVRTRAGYALLRRGLDV